MKETPGFLQTLGYTRARRFLLLVGLIGLSAIAAVTYLRGVRGPEALVAPLFIPIFIAFVAWGFRGGMLAGAIAGAVYVALRYRDVQIVGFDQLGSTVALRVIAFLAFGFLGGWASRELESSLTKLDLYDQIDDATGLYNARFFLQDTDLEMTRSKRYRTIFSVSVVDVPVSALEALSRRQRRGALREVGRLLRDSVRNVDRAVHARSKQSYRLAVVLPETSREGARVFTERFAQRLTDYLTRRGASAVKLEGRFFTHPEDEEGLRSVRTEFEEIERAEHPEEFGSTSRRAGGAG